MRCGRDSLALDGNPSKSLLAGQGNSLVLVESPPRSLQVSKQNLRKGGWSFSAVASNSSRKRLFQNKTCVSGYAKTVSLDGAEEII